MIARLTSLSAAVCLAFCASAVDQLQEVEVWGRRPLRDIGTATTAIDSGRLRDNPAQSVADVLAFSSSAYIKSYGRASQSTISFRGTSAAHTQVAWNGLSLNDPMFGSTDLSMIPAFFVDCATLYHGATGVNHAGGGLGGVVSLSTCAPIPQGFSATYTQGIGSFSTFDEYIRVGWGSPRLQTALRASVASSRNDFMYTNRDKKLNIYDDDRNIVDQYYPRERNRNGAFRDINLLHELKYSLLRNLGRLSLTTWLTDSDRELPMLSTSYNDSYRYENYRRQRSLRSVAEWKLVRDSWRLSAATSLAAVGATYKYAIATDGVELRTMAHSRSRLTSWNVHSDGEWRPYDNLSLASSIAFYTHRVDNQDLTRTLVGLPPVGYNLARSELSASASARWQVSQAVGLAAVVRQEIAGEIIPYPVPAVFADITIPAPGRLMLRASGTRNCRIPSINDLYYLPGGNPDLRPETGWSYDAGAQWSYARPGSWALTASATWFDSYISDWIIWLPSPRGFYTPRNMRLVHAYGVEARADFALKPLRELKTDIGFSYSWTPSINNSSLGGSADRSAGRQLPYIPRHTATGSASASLHSWRLALKGCFYSRRFTMTSNDPDPLGSVPPYFVANASLQKSFDLHTLQFVAKLAVNNIFDSDYISVMSHPMPGANAELFLTLNF